jgi:uncharacterized membrane protein YuzA (DUF378 family)
MNYKEEKHMKIVQKVALIFTIIGAINWGLIGLFDFNLVESLFGTESFVSNAVYTIVGISGLVNIMLLFMDIHD